MHRISLVLACLGVLAGCDRSPGGDAAAPTAAIADLEVREVAAADGYGQPGSEIAGAAFWSHPGVNFASLVIAATPDGLTALNIETGEVVTSADGFAADGVAVAYLGEGASAQGYAVAAASGDGYRFYAIDNASMELRLSPTLMVSSDDASGFCLGKGAEATALVLHQATKQGLLSYSLHVSDAGVTADPSTTTRIRGGAAACAIDDLSGAVYAVSPDGDVFRARTPGRSAEKIASTGIVSLNSIAAFPSRAAADDDADDADTNDNCCLRLAILDGDAGVIHVVNGNDGRILGAVRIKSTFDLDAVDSISAMGAGYGNYGGVYRDGALAVVTSANDGAPIRLTPWRSVLSALELESGEPVDPRTLHPVEEDEPDAISIDPVQP